MNSKGTKFVKGMKRTRAIAIVVLLAVLVCCASVTAFALDGRNSDKFQVERPDGAVETEKDGLTYVDWSQVFSTNEQVNLHNSGVFNVTDVLNLKRIEVTIPGVYYNDSSERSAIQASADTAGSKNMSFVNNAGHNTVITYSSATGITASEANNFFSRIQLTFDTNLAANGSAQITVRGLDDEKESSNETLKNNHTIGRKLFTAEVKFYNYATGAIDPESVYVSYRNKNLLDSGDADVSVISPDDSNCGMGSFQMTVDPGDVWNTASALDQVTVGYVIKKSTDTWTVSDEVQGRQELKNLDEVGPDNPIMIEMEGFDANQDYDVRGVIITAGRTENPRYTDSVRIRYDKPAVNTFNIGDTSAAYKGGQNKEIAVAVAFNNTNYDDTEEGAQVEVKLQFTKDLQPAERTAGTVDTSVWEDIKDGTVTASMGPSQRLYNHTFQHFLPTEDGKRSAYRLVVTDKAAGYSVYQYSPAFVLDSTAPASPEVTTTDVSADKALGLKDGALVTGGVGTAKNFTIKVGPGKDNEGNILEDTSGIRSYSYAIYFLPSEQGDAFAREFAEGLTVDQAVRTTHVAAALKAAALEANAANSVLPAKYKNYDIEVTDWTALPAPTDGYTSFSVSKDGYYCVLAKGTDNVNLDSEPTPAMFRVDKTTPEVPQVRFATPKAGQTVDHVSAGSGKYSIDASKLQAYDNRTYTDTKNVWVFAKAQPQTGKTIDVDQYEYSLDGGLNWNLLSSTATYVNVGGTINDVYDPQNYGAGLGSFDYDVAFRLPEPSSTDAGYQTVMIRATDNLGGQSNPTEAFARRQSQGKVNTTATLSHTTVEVALALGNTRMKGLTNLSDRLRNAVAQKINERYYGAPTNVSVKDPNAAGWNPINLLYTGNTIHTCTWEGDGKECKDGANCPYVKYGEEYQFYTPSMVTMQGLQGANANDTSKFSWVRYDHTQYMKVDTDGDGVGDRQIPTVAFIDNMIDRTDDKPDTTKATYVVKNSNGTKTTRYTATKDRVVYLPQKKAYAGGINEMMQKEVEDTSPLVDLAANPKSKQELEKRGLGKGGGGGVTAETNYAGASIMDKVLYMHCAQWRNTNIWEYELKTPEDDSSPYNTYRSIYGDGTRTDGSAYIAPWDSTLAVEGSNASRYFTKKPGTNEIADGITAGWANVPGNLLPTDHPLYGKSWFDCIDWDKPIWDTWNEAGKFIRGIGIAPSDTPSERFYSLSPAGESRMIRRIYHMIDMTGATTKTWHNGYQYKVNDLGALEQRAANGEPVMQEIYSVGYMWSGARDWLFLNNDQPTKKEISFTVDDRECFAHANDGFGFLFNTTIRQNINGTWVMSGYLFMEGGGGNILDYTWGIFKFTDLDMNWFADGALTCAGRYGNFDTESTMALHGNDYNRDQEDLWMRIRTGWHNYTAESPNPETGKPGWLGTHTQGDSKTGTMSIDLIGYSVPDIKGTSVRNYRMVLDGNETKIYVYNSGTTKLTTEQLDQKFAEDTAKGDYVPGVFDGTAAADKFSLITWTSVPTENDFNKVGGNVAVLRTSAPSVDGYEVGDTSELQEGQTSEDRPHTDTNCYGFGPLTSAVAWGCGCDRDTNAVFSNISMKLNVARRLSEVVKEPKWGGAKAKYILNVSNDSVSDFTNPVLSASIQNRVMTDGARLITWGSLLNQPVTEEFNKTIDGRGTFQVSRTTDDTDTSENELQNIAEYIAKTYYNEYGLDGEGNVQDQVNAQAGEKGQVYALADAEKMSFGVKPITLSDGTVVDYNETSANEDYPSGRWYMIHDTEGYENVQKNSMDGTYSDGLNLKVSAPGRYSVYFAPDKEKAAGGLLDPNDDSCIFDFVVNQAPKAQFTGTIGEDGKTITVEDFSYDPDAPSLNPNDEQPKGWNEQGTAQTQINGITTAQWRWNMTVQYTDPVTQAQEVRTIAWYGAKPADSTFAESWTPGQYLNPFNGLTIESLTKGHVSNSQVKAFQDAGITLNGLAGNSSSGYYFTSIPDGAVITLFEKVTDISTRRVVTPDGKIGYQKVGESTSAVARGNLVSGVGVTVAAQSLMTATPLNMYDTAPTSSVVTITRSSTHPQGKNFNLGWEIDVGDGKGFQTLTDPNASNSARAGDVWKLGADTVLTATSDGHPTCVGGVASGKWTMSYDFIKKASQGVYNREIVLRITETLRGVPVGSEDGKEQDIMDYSSRTVYFRQDTVAPSAQSVVVKTNAKAEGSDLWSNTETEYEASAYLDVSKGDKRVRIHVGDSADTEGSVAGYGYYFYDKDASGNMTNIYKMVNGELVEITNADVAAYKSALSGKTKTTDGEDIFIPNTDLYIKILLAVGENVYSVNGSNVTLTHPRTGVLSGSGGTIDISKKRNNGKPTDSLNVTIFAFDNQHYKTAADQKRLTSTNVTLANETARSRIENIKLANFTPMPPEITAQNALGDTMAHIGNEQFMTDAHTVDKQDVDTPANSNVTISFKPRQGWFRDVSGDKVYQPALNPDYGLSDSVNQGKWTGSAGEYSKLYLDESKYADLTNKAQISYVLEKQNQLGEYEKQGDTTVIDATKTVTVSETGKYRLTAEVVNGSRSYSKSRQITFEIDKTAPAGMQVQLMNSATTDIYDIDKWPSGWYKRVRLLASGARDDNGVTYYYSTDNGATWSTSETGIDISLTETGEYNLRVYAVDKAGNQTGTYNQIVRIDASAPVMSPPSVIADVDNRVLYTEYVISLGNTENGTLYAMQDNGDPDLLNTEIVVPVHQSKTFIVTPDAGYQIESVTYTHEKVTEVFRPADMIDREDGSYEFSVMNVVADAQMTAKFTDGSTSARVMSMRAAINDVARTASSIPKAAAAPLADSADELDVVGVSSDINGTVVLSIDGSEVSGGTAKVSPGSDVKFIFRPEDGYIVDTVTVTRGTEEPVTVTPTETAIAHEFEYTETNIQQNVTVRATFKPLVIHKLTLRSDVVGEVTVVSGARDNGDGTYSFYDGNPIRVKLNAKEDGYVPVAVKLNNGSRNVIGDGMSKTVEYVISEEEAVRDLILWADFAIADSSGTRYGVTLSYDNKLGHTLPEGNLVNGKQTIYIFEGGKRTVLIYPEPGYAPTGVNGTKGVAVLSTYNTEALQYTDTEITLTPLDDGGYSCEISDIENNFAILRIDFTQNTYKITPKIESLEEGKPAEKTGGTVTFTRSDGQTSVDAVPEGVDVTCTITPSSGWRIGGVSVTDEDGDVKDYGTRRELILNAVRNNCQVNVTFVKQIFSGTESNHILSVMATNISDNQQSLHATETYQFQLRSGENAETVVQDPSSKSAWSKWQSSPSYVYSGLDPNTKYTVVVRAQDVSGNASTTEIQTSNSKSAYTRANMPNAVSLASADSENTVNKTVDMVVDPSGNPSGTEYSVLMSKYPSMRSSEVADVNLNATISKEEDLKGWESQQWVKLDNGHIYIYNLPAGQRYYMQIIARNKEDVRTTANSENILNIMLSPSAPAANSLYFEEQAKPDAPIVLHWATPGDGVTGFEIYRNGAPIATLAATETSYTDSAVMPDMVYQYSYAYVNSAGTGSRRTAVSKEYYDAAHADDTAKLETMVKLVVGEKAELAREDYEQAEEVYSYSMTYPAFPETVSVRMAVPVGSTTTDGIAEAYIRQGSGVSNRSGRYEVSLQAYEKGEDGTYTPVADWDRSAYTVVTKNVDNAGGLATWEGLNINYEYRVFVNKVMSTGPRIVVNGRVTDGYNGSTNGPEYEFEKTYTVTRDGYQISYPETPRREGAASAYGKLDSFSGTWDAGEAEDYSKTGWDNALKGDAATGDYIKFNKTPHIVLANNTLAENTNADVIQANDGTDTVLIDQSKEDMKFTVKVKVWDTDGPGRKDGSFIVSADLEGQPATLKGSSDGKLKKDQVPEKESEAAVYELEFDGSRLSTGKYKELTLRISDGNSQGVTEETFPVMINRSAPTITTSNGGATKQIEAGRDYGTESAIQVSASVAAAGKEDANMQSIRLTVMGDRYQELFGAKTPDGIQNRINKNQGSARTNAKEVLGATTYNQYMKNGSFDTTETADLIAKVSPTVTGYFEITKEQYDSVPEAERGSVEEMDSGYWATTEYAFQKGWCQFLSRDGSGNVTVTGTVGGVYSGKLKANFGNNASILTIYFKVMSPPSVTIRSKKVWRWEEAGQPEFEAYQAESWTVQDIFDANVQYMPEDQRGEPWLTDTSYQPTDPAYRQTLSGYEVFKLCDDEVIISTDMIRCAIDVNPGVYGHISNVYYVLTRNPDFNPETDEGKDPTDKRAQIKTATGSGDLYDTGTDGESFRVSGLDKGQTYYAWVFYDVTDPDDSTLVHRFYSPNYTAITMEQDYDMATYSFENTTDKRKEADAGTDGIVLNYQISRSDSLKPQTTLKATIKYYMANQDGQLVDESGELLAEGASPVELTGERLEAAKRTLYLTKDSETFAPNEISKFIQLRLENNEDQQGHMLAYVTLNVDPEADNEGFSRIPASGRRLTIFVQDDESKVISYVVGFDDVEGLTPITVEGSKGKHYNYNFTGLQENYGGVTGTLTMALKNMEDGAISDISAELFNEDKVTPSTNFVFQKNPRPSLPEPVNESAKNERSELIVSPASSLEEGVYTGWLKITWKDALEEDEIWVKLNQVVGHNTLRGYIYLTADKPSEYSTAYTGKSLIQVFDRSEYLTGNRDPQYETWTDDTGYYEIPNILTNARYFIKVSRPGFLAFDGPSMGLVWAPGSTSAVWELSMQLVGGDINNDGVINGDDYNALKDYYNKTYDVETEPEDSEIRKYDYNADGVVNALDRMVVWENQRLSLSDSRNQPAAYKSPTGGWLTPVKVEE